MNATEIRTQLADKRLNSYDVISEFLGELGYSYAGDAPVPTRNWPDSVKKYEVQPIYAAQHGDFKIIYCEMKGERMLRTVQRPIIDQLARAHPFFMVIFHQKHGNIWEFVNVSVTQDDDASRVRRIARRISITEAERVRDRLYTAAERLEQIDLNGKQNYTALQVQSLHNGAFDIEQVTKDFYNQYTKVFAALSDDIAQRNPSIKQDAGVEALRLLDRLMFLYFIQKKGWLNQDYAYLYNRFQDHTDRLDATSFYENVIVPLFYALANREGRLHSVGNVPFLNGGLFQFDQTSPVYRLKISNRVFQTMFKDLFERYNFTVEEDMPDDRAVAIDPEMLGKVFESLILNIEQEKDLRKSTGSYYTPRTVVSFMCQQSLREYIVQRWRDDHEGQEDYFQDRIMRFVEDGIPGDLSKDEARQVRRWLLDVRVVDPAVGSGAFLVGMLQEIIRLVGLLDEYTGDQNILDVNYVYDLKRDIIGKCLYGVDIQPQAVQICELRLWLSLIVEYEPEESDKPFETWVAHIEPLPNLSYLVRQGNSLIEQVFGETVQLDATGLSNQITPVINDIQDKKAHYYDETDRGQKHRLDTEILRLQISLTRLLLERKASDVRRDLNKAFPTQLAGMERDLSRKEQREKNDLEARLVHLKGLVEQAEAVRKRADSLTATMSGYADEITKLRNQLGAFIWRVDFGEVFTERGGFDIAIANPPYIRQEKIIDIKGALKQLFEEVYSGRADLFVYFFACTLKLLREGGNLAFITPNKFARAGYGEGLRHLLNQYDLKLLIDFGDLAVFDATTYPFITILHKRSRKADLLVKILTVSQLSDLDNLATLVRSTDSISQDVLRKDGWQLTDPKTLDLLEKLRTNTSTLERYIKNEFFTGLKTGLNAAFVVGEDAYQKFIMKNPNAASIVHPWLRGKDIRRWAIKESGMYILFTYHGVDIEKYPEIEQHLIQYKDKLLKRATSNSHAWYELQQPQMGIYHHFEQPKIVYPDIALSPQFALDTSGSYPDMTGFLIPRQDLYLLGVLNSNMNHWFFQNIGASIQGGYLRFQSQYMRQVPIANPTHEQRSEVEAIVSQLLQPGIKRTEIKRLEGELNKVVYAVNGLTDDEIALIERAVNPAIEKA
jgi:adenine-specific DNA-methyltransferase